MRKKKRREKNTRVVFVILGIWPRVSGAPPHIPVQPVEQTRMQAAGLSSALPSKSATCFAPCPSRAKPASLSNVTRPLKRVGVEVFG